MVDFSIRGLVVQRLWRDRGNGCRLARWANSHNLLHQKRISHSTHQLHYRPQPLQYLMGFFCLFLWHGRDRTLVKEKYMFWLESLPTHNTKRTNCALICWLLVCIQIECVRLCAFQQQKHKLFKLTTNLSLVWKTFSPPGWKEVKINMP